MHVWWLQSHPDTGHLWNKKKRFILAHISGGSRSVGPIDLDLGQGWQEHGGNTYQSECLHLKLGKREEESSVPNPFQVYFCNDVRFIAPPNANTLGTRPLQMDLWTLSQIIEHEYSCSYWALPHRFVNSDMYACIQQASLSICFITSIGRMLEICLCFGRS